MHQEVMMHGTHRIPRSLIGLRLEGLTKGLTPGDIDNRDAPSVAVQPYRNPLGKKAPVGGATVQKAAGAAAAGAKPEGESLYAEHTVKLLAGSCPLPSPPPPSGRRLLASAASFYSGNDVQWL